jgi:threonylcarbamoyladenosine tRNA methylthiotransferase MtaB
VGVDILVGFPGESEAGFDETCLLLQETPIAYAHVFKYSDRKGAAATLMNGKIDPRTLHARSERAREIGLRKRRAFHERHLGATVEVLFEEKADGYWWGYTGNYIQVAACSDECLENTLRYVVLSSDRGEHMQGQLAEDNRSLGKGIGFER